MKFPGSVLFMLYFPLHKILVLIMSFFAMFTDEYYVSVKAPDDYDHVTYYRALHSLFCVVKKRDEREQEKIRNRLEKRKIKQEEKLQYKEEHKLENEEKKQKNLKTADKILGAVLKIIPIIIILIILYYIIK